ncbi:MAG: sugar isomerase domain-containing protein, partial [Thermomicrobiales bacterium]
MPVYRNYFRRLYDVIESVIGSQSPQVETVAGWMADSIADHGVVHLFGSGHSHIIAEEVFHRAGSLLPLNPILDVNLTLLSSVNATKLERTEGYGQVIADSQDIRSGEIVFVISNSGVNPVPIDFALRCNELGARTI